MESGPDGFKVLPYPAERRMVTDGGRLNSGRHTVTGLYEVDVTRPRALLRDYKARTGESLSFTGFAIYCLGQAVAANPLLHACRDWRGRLVLFDKVCVSTSFAVDNGIRKAHLTHILKAVNQRTFQDINAEIRAFQAGGIHGTETKFIDAFVHLPWPVRRLFYWAVMHNPRLEKDLAGTVSLTAIGMFGKGGGWAIPFLLHSLAVALGGIAERPCLVNGRIEAHEYLCVTLCLDHDVVDGAPAARFAGQFRELLEAGAGLDL